jgi:hypothetical protein
MRIRFGIYDDFATRFTHSEGWWYSKHCKKRRATIAYRAFTFAELNIFKVRCQRSAM